MLHTCFVTDIYEKARQVGADVYVFFTPKEEKDLVREILGKDMFLFSQEGFDLGERMKNAIGSILRKGYEKVILIGTDIPQIKLETFENAFAALDDSDIVINPTFDGGYYLIGMKREHDAIWRIEHYGTNTVVEDTLQRIKDEKLSVAMGETYYDIDDREDLVRLYREIMDGTVFNCSFTERYMKKTLREKLEHINENY